MLLNVSLWPFTQVGQMSQESYAALIHGARAELRDTSLKLYYRACGILDGQFCAADADCQAGTLYAAGGHIVVDDPE